MQRLFTTFPNAAPGAGLLVMRVTAAVPLICAALLCQFDSIHLPLPSYFIVPAGLIGLLLLIGLWTPVASAIVAALYAWAAFTDSSYGGCLALVVIAGSLVFLGPGAWSADARLFGRKRVQFEP